MAKYKVARGKHIAAGGQVYTKGQVIESDTNLVEAFPGKFVDAAESDAVTPIAVDGSRVLTKKGRSSENPDGLETVEHPKAPSSKEERKASDVKAAAKGKSKAPWGD